MILRTLVFCALCASVTACGTSVAPQRDGSMTLDAMASTDASARDSSVAPDVAAQCNEATLTGLRVPTVIRSAESCPIAADVAASGCGCRAEFSSVREQEYTVQLCGCTEAACVDPRYVVNWDGEARMVIEDTDERVRVGPSTVVVHRVAAGRGCSPSGSRIESVVIEADNDARTSGPRRVWARVSGTALRCSDDPLEWIEVRPGSPMFLSAQDCQNFDCDGPTSPRPFSVWVMLGTFTPGTYSIFYSPGISQEFRVQ